jgi:hypothetical protein
MLGTVHSTRRFDRVGTPVTLLNEIAQLSRQTEEAARRRKTLLGRGLWLLAWAFLGGGIVFVLLLVAAGAAATELEEDFGTVAVVAAIALGTLHFLFALGLAVFCFVRRSSISADRLDPEKLALVRSLLQTFAADVDPSTPLRLFVDFGAAESTRATLGHGSLAWFHRWLHVNATLLDRSVLRIDALLRMKRKTRQKRRYTKQKTVFQDVIDVRVSFRKGTALAPDAAAKIKSKLAYAFPQLLRCRATERAVFLRHVTAPCLELKGGATLVQGREQRLGPRMLTNVVFRDYRAAAGARQASASAR